MTDTYAPHSEGRDYTRQSGPEDAARQFFSRYLDFAGRSNRGEFWWWVLVNLVVSIVLSIIDSVIFGAGVFQGLWSLVVFIPGLALGVRRLHDIDRSGWWLLIFLIPLIGWLILIYWAIQKPTPGPNRFG